MLICYRLKYDRFTICHAACSHSPLPAQVKHDNTESCILDTSAVPVSYPMGSICMAVVWPRGGHPWERLREMPVSPVIFDDEELRNTVRYNEPRRRCSRDFCSACKIVSEILLQTAGASPSDLLLRPAQRLTLGSSW